MKKFVFAILALFILGLPLFASAAKTSQQSIYTLGAGEEFSGNLYRGASDITLDGKVEGDVFVAANKITINGEIDGSLFAAANEIVIGESAKIFGNAYLAASTLNLNGDFENNAYAFGSNLSSSDKSFFKRDLYAFGGSLDLDGWIGRDLRSSAGTAVLKTIIMRDAQFYDINQLRLNKGTEISGNLTYRSENNAQISNEVKISGKTEKHNPVNTNKEKNGALAWLLSAIYGLLAFLLTALLVVIFFPNKTKMISESIAQKFGANLLTGLVVLIVVPIIGIILFCTLIGIPVALILLVIYGTMLYLGKLFVGVIAGRYIIDRFCPKWSEKTRLVIGTLKGAGIIYILTLIPILGGIIGFLATLLALGAIWNERGRFDFVETEVKTKK